MTIGIGFSCAEGVGLLTDSMVNLAHAGGYVPRPGSRSFHWLGSVRTAVVVSGNLSGDMSQVDTLCAGIAAPTAEAAVAHLFAELSADEQRLRASWPLYDQLGLSGGGRTPEVLAVGGPPREPLRLGRLGPGKVEWVRAGERAFLPIGAWRWHFLDPLGVLQRPAPLTLAGCLDRATTWARAYIAAIYGGSSLEGMLADGHAPTVGYPLHAIAFDRSGGFREHRFEEIQTKELIHG